MSIRFVIPLVYLCFAGCAPQPTVNAPVAAQPVRTIQYDDDRLHIDGDNWIFAFPTVNGEAYIVGEDVAFVEEKESHVVVNLDRTQTQHAQGEQGASYILTNVTTNGDHKVLLVTRMGTTECDIAVPASIVLPEFLESVLSEKNAGRSSHQ